MTIREEVVGFGTGSSLVGIVTHPSEFDADRPAILLLAGGWPRIGPLRLLVRLSRHLAGLGFFCLRFDFSGVGESAPRQDEVPRARSNILETIEAMDFLQTTFGVRTFVGLGLCRGARVCFAAAAQDPRITALALIQADVLTESRRESAIWRELSSRADFRSLTRLSSWLRLLRGKAVCDAPDEAEIGLGYEAKRIRPCCRGLRAAVCALCADPLSVFAGRNGTPVPPDRPRKPEAVPATASRNEDRARFSTRT